MAQVGGGPCCRESLLFDILHAMVNINRKGRSRAGSHVNRIAGVTLDETGFIHTAYGSYHPVTGEGLPIDAPDELMREILTALIHDSLDSGPAVEFDFDEFMKRKFGCE